jgi:hypothetical protein
MWIERTHYFAKPGCAEQVLHTRRRACAVRAAIGLPAGAIYLRAGGDGPDIAWQCEFDTDQSHEADLRARAESPEFEAVRAAMRNLIDRFERIIERRDAPEPSHAAGAQP